MKPWSFVVAADLHLGSPKSYRFNPGWLENWREARAQIVNIKPDFLLVAGDLTRDGNLHRFELEEAKADLDALSFPVHVVPGNMDTGNKHTRCNGVHRAAHECSDLDLNVTSAQLRQFASVFGPLWWSFDHKGVRFSGFADMVVNSGLPEENQFWAWAEEQKHRPRTRGHVWMMHYPLFVERPEEPAWDIREPAQYQNWYFSVDPPGRQRLLDLFKATGATLVISGHVHCHRETEADGIRFVIAPATSFVQWARRWPDANPALGFLRYTVSESGIAGAFVPLRTVHKTPGYGPAGHPAPPARDYSLAWEKPS